MMSPRNAPALDLPARFMALSLISFALSIGSFPWHLRWVQGPFTTFHLLALVHSLTLGFIGSMLFGASYQLVPVVVGRPLSSVRAGRLSFWFYLTGLILFLAGLTLTWLPGLAIGGTLLGVAFLIYIVVIATTVWQARRHAVVAGHLLAGAIASGAGMSVGVLLAFNKSSGILGGHLLPVLGAHITIMLAGWVGLTFTGVAYRLIGMFTLADRHLIRPLAWTELGLTASGTTLLAVRLLGDFPSWLGQLGAVLIVGGFASFVYQVIHLYRNRMRKGFDIHIPFALTAASASLIAAVSLAYGLFRHLSPLDELWVATIFLVILGVAGTAIQGFFYKISTFLVWLRRYAPIAGKQDVPKLEELYNKQLGMVGFALWIAGIIGCWLAILTGRHLLPVLSLLLVAGAGCFFVNVLAIARHGFGNRDAKSAPDRRGPKQSGRIPSSPATPVGREATQIATMRQGGPDVRNATGS